MRCNFLGLPAAATAVVAAASFMAVGGNAAAQLEVGWRDADLGGTVDVVMSAPAGTTYVTIISLTEGPTCFGPKHPVGCIDVDFTLIDLSFLIPNFFATMGPSGTVTEQLDLDPDPALDGVVVNLQMVSLVSGKFTAKSPLCKLQFAFNDEWLHSVAPLFNDPAAVPAIALDDGRIAFFGAQGANLDACEAWDPCTQQSSPLASLPSGRAAHTVTKLQDGRVLVCGGADLLLAVNGGGEVYDPSTNTWTPTGPMVTGRAVHTANLLPDGRVLIAGGTSDVTDVVTGATNALRSTELYDPVTNSFSAGPNLARPHVGHVAVTLASGDVLIGGGGTYSTLFGIRIPAIDNHAQGFLVGSGTFSSEVTMKAARAGASGVLLADGRVLVAGGIGGSITALTNLASAEAFNPVTGTWANVGSMSLGRTGMPMVVLPGTNQVLVAGGATGTSVTTPVPSDVVELFDPVAGTFSLRAPLPEPRAGSAAIVLPMNHAAFFGGVGVPSPASIYHD
ncbi:MAG: hypothetical protein JNL90_14400 [Planctomycetes bacterium]|nr:hypothetical protein [Planctomycetota bacterium]